MKKVRYSATELARNALENMADAEIAMQMFEEIGSREEAIDWILDNCPKTVEFLAEQEQDYLDAAETDRLYEYDFR